MFEEMLYVLVFIAGAGVGFFLCACLKVGGDK